MNTGSGNYATPNPHQDVVGKIAFDPKVRNRSLHLEVGGVLTRFAFFNPLTRQHYDAAGGGGSVNVNIEVVKNLRVVANTFFSDGAGRYIFGLGPDVIIQGDGGPSLVHSTSTVDGLEYQARPNLAFYGYYGRAYFDQNVAVDPADGEPVGFGYTGSPSNHNRSIQQGTFGFSQTIARDPSYGGLQWGVQYLLPGSRAAVRGAGPAGQRPREYGVLDVQIPFARRSASRGEIVKKKGTGSEQAGGIRSRQPQTAQGG